MMVVSHSRAFVFPFVAKSILGAKRTICTNDGKEIFNVEFATAHAKDGLSFGTGGRSIENYTSSETKINGTYIFLSIKQMEKMHQLVTLSTNLHGDQQRPGSPEMLAICMVRQLSLGILIDL